MTTPDSPTSAATALPVSTVSRRRLLRGTAVGLVAAGATSGRVDQADAAPDGRHRRETEPFHGRHQAGITTPQQTHALFAAFDLTSTDRALLEELLQGWTGAAEAMTQGRPAPERPGRVPGTRSDSGIALGVSPARLTVTFGFGSTLFDHRFDLQSRRPAALQPLPAFPGDQLVAEQSGGDLIVQLCADDPQVLAHAFLQIRSLAVRKAALRWSQLGFISPPRDHTAPRNLLGLHDGTANPTPQDADYNSLVWADGASTPPWMRGGSYLVFRKIRLNLPSWSQTPADEQDRALGRRLDDGSPLSAPPGAAPHTPLRLAAHRPDGTPLIDPQAHVRQMHPFPMLRRGYNYDYGFDPRLHHDHTNDQPGHEEAGHGGHDAYDAGLLFATYNADPSTQFVPAQQQLATNDLMARFMTPTASAVFALPPGLRNGEHLGQHLLSGQS